MSEAQQSNTEVRTPIDYAALMKQAAQQAMEQEKPDAKFISFKSGVLAFNDTPVAGNKIDVVVISSAFENTFYLTKYDPKKLRSPDCWAVGHVEADMAPTNDVENPVAPDCDGCPNNEWESDPEGGKGKACKNIRRLAIIPASELDNLATTDVLYAKLPVTSVANWSKYVNQIGNVVKRPPFGVITELSVVPDMKSQFKVNFMFKGLVPDNYLEQLVPIHEAQQEAILFGYKPNEEEFEQAKPTKPATKGK